MKYLRMMGYVYMSEYYIKMYKYKCIHEYTLYDNMHIQTQIFVIVEYKIFLKFSTFFLKSCTFED